MKIKLDRRATIKMTEKETEAFTEILRYLWNEVEIEPTIPDAGEAGVDLVYDLLRTLSPATL